MKLLILLYAIFGCQVFGYVIEIPKTIFQPTDGTSDWVHRQKLILYLFDNVCETSKNPTVVRLANEFSLSTAAVNYDKPELVTVLQNLVNENKLKQQGKIFSEYNEDDVFELKAVFSFLYYAKNFDGFFSAAAWARQNVNCGIYIDALYAALFHRRDTEKIAIPPPYELLPNYFINKEVLSKIVSIDGGKPATENVKVEGNIYTISENYTANFLENEDESKLVYFYEDVGLNSYYFLRRLQNTQWDEGLNHTTHGEYWFHVVNQLIARYNLERYGNGFSDIQDVSFTNLNSERHYDSMLMYSNGDDFPQVSILAELTNKPEYIRLKNIEQNIGSTVTSMKENGHTKSEILNNLMDSYFFQTNSYESDAIHLVRNYLINVDSAPTVLEHYMTMLRDPFYWKILKQIVSQINDAFKVLPSYSRNELYFPGVEVSNVITKKIATSYEFLDIDVTNALRTNFNNVLNNMQVKVSQPRLSNKAFNIKINITSQVTQKGLVKIYLTPKVLPAQLSSSNFFLLDAIEYNFKMGANIISRSSDQFRTSGELYSMNILTKNVEDAEFGLDSLPMTDIESYANFPARLLLPKGSSSGTPYQLFIFVAPFVKSTAGSKYSAEFNTAAISPGYPFDLVEDISTLFNLPNSMFKEIIITHKGDDKIFNFGEKDEESSKKWSESTYDYSSKKGSSYDYKAKKGKYGTKIDQIILDETTVLPTTTAKAIFIRTNEAIDNMIEAVPNDLKKDDVPKPTYSYIDQLYDYPGADNNNFEENTEAPMKVKKYPSVYDWYRLTDQDNDYEFDDRVYE